MVRLAASRGYSVCFNFRENEVAANSVVCEIVAGGGKAVAIRADISSDTDVVSLFQTTECELGPVTALVNNAARLETQMRLESMDAERLRRTFATNAIGAMLFAREAVLRMSTLRNGHGGRIVNVLVRGSALRFPGRVR